MTFVFSVYLECILYNKTFQGWFKKSTNIKLQVLGLC